MSGMGEDGQGITAKVAFNGISIDVQKGDRRCIAQVAS